MRIAIIHHQLQYKGGMETYLLNLIDEFSAQADCVTAYVYKKIKLPTTDCHAKRFNLSWLPRKWRKLIFGLFVYRYKKLRDYDLRITLMRARYQDMMVCGGTHLGYLNNTGKKPSLLDRLEIKLEQSAYTTADVVIAHSKSLEKELIQLYGIAPEKIVCIYPPVDTSKFHQRYRSEREHHKAQHNIPLKKTIILFPSTGHERKGIYLLLEAMKRLPLDEYELIVAGDNLVGQQPPNCRFVGFIKDMAMYYTMADVTVLPSYYEPFGLVATESMQCGTPVILSPFVGAIDFVNPDNGIILEALTVEHLVQALKEIKSKKFTIPANFAESNGLTLSEHVKQLKAVHRNRCRPRVACRIQTHR